MRHFVIIALLLLASCGGRVDDSRSFVDRDVTRAWDAGEETGPKATGVPGWEPVQTGAFSGANTTGVAAVYMKDGRRELVLERFSGVQGTVYLTRDGSRERAITLGQTGQGSYAVPSFADDGYTVVLVVGQDGGIAQAPLS